ncbi:MAG: DUF4430 domain-containing protein [Bacillota bacterium]|nr:DUF4430 domain-containing protein [Bacillota bacterium]
MKKRILSILMIIMMFVGMLPQTAFATERVEGTDQVRVIVENTTYAEAAWTGTLVDTWVDIDSSSTMMSCVVDALDEKGYTQTGAESGFISEINGLGSGRPDAGSGWMGSINDWFTNEGFDAFTVASGKLEDGDEIRIMFSAYGYGEDLGGIWGNNDKTVKALEFSAGTLDQSFSASEHEYTLTLPEGTTGVKVTPTAANKNFQVRTSVAGTEYKRTETVPVSNGTVITVTCGDPAWPSMNAGEFGSGAENVPAEVYTINVVIEEPVEEPVKGTEVNVENNVIDITDYQFAKLASNYAATATAITISDADVVYASEDGKDIYIVLSNATAENQQVKAAFATTGKLNVSQNANTVTLAGGKGDLSVTLDGKFGSKSYGTVTYNLHFSCEKPPTEVPARLIETVDEETYQYVPLTLELKDCFKGAKEFYLVENGELIPLEGNKFDVDTAEIGSRDYVFAAGNAVGVCEEYVTFRVTVKEIESGAYIGHTTSNGALNSVQFMHEDGSLIDGITAYYDADSRTVNVELPKDYPVNGKVKSTYNLTQKDGLPFITTSNAAAGSSTASSKKFTSNTVTLKSGAATFTFYLYNVNPKATDNPYTIFTVKYKVKNDIPTLAEGQEAEISATITAGETFAIDLEPLFSDVDGDSLTYKVSINENEATPIERVYNYSTNIAGEYTLVFTANDGKGDSEDTYTVNLTVKNVDEKAKMTVNVPEGLTPEFYATKGFEAGFDVLGDKQEATAGNSKDGMTSYEVSFPLNAEYISIRTEEWGGMAFAAEADKTVTLRQVKIQATNLKDEPADSITAAGYGEYKAYGKDGQYLLVTGEEYIYEAAPVDSGTYENASLTKMLEDGDSVYEISLPLKYKNAKTITAPTGAKVQLFKYKQYYSQEVLEAKAGLDNGDGTTTWYFTPKDRDQLNYRVSMEGKITKTGYLGYNDNNIQVTYSEDDAAPDTTETSGSNTSVGDNSVLVNVEGGENNLSMSVGEIKTLKGYRAWEIIKTQSENHIITPDFHFDVISGKDVVELSSKKSNSNGGSEELSDWRTIKALRSGTAIIEVSYDAIQVTGGSWPGVYGATDPARTGLVVVQVGGHDSSVEFGIDGFAGQGSMTYKESNARNWDAEFDTLYFTGDYGELELSPTASSDITEVAVSNDKGGSWTAIEAENGVYTAKIAHGNNIIRVTTGAGTAYQVVRGDKVTSSILEKRGDGDGVVEAGETARVILNGLHTPIPKMAGNYNPGYRQNNEIEGGDGGVHIKYSFNDDLVEGPKVQYTFGAESNYVDVAIPEDYAEETVVLKDGYIGLAVIGLTSFANGGDSHRNIPDAGCTTRGSSTSMHTRSILPEIEFKLGEAAAENTAPTVKNDAVTEDSIEMGQKYALNPETLFEDAEGDELTFTVSVNGGEAVTAAADYKFEPSAEGEYELTFTASDEEQSVSHSVKLTVTAASQEDDEEMVFDISGNQIKGYVNVSVEDKGVRVEGETGLKYPVALGTIVEETKVPYAEGDTIADVTLRLLDAKKMGYDYSGTTKSRFYLSAIKNFIVDGVPYDEMGELDAGQGSGWMITHNDEFIGAGASEFIVKDGDTVVWKYSCQLGADIGDPFYDKNAEDVIDLIDEIDKVITLDSAAEITAARTAYDALPEEQQAEVTNYDKLVAAEKALAELLIGAKKESYEDVYKKTGNYLKTASDKTAPVVNSEGGEWLVLGLSRSGYDVPAGYYDNVVKHVKENINDEGQLHATKSSENSRVVLALTSAGIDPRDVDGHDLLEGLTDMSYVKKQGINGPIWALIAFDSHDYKIPEGGDVTREALIETILDAQLADGGWALSGDVSDVDMTAMALQALAPYYNDNDEVKAAVDKALDTLSEKQLIDGTFGSTDGACAESCAQVIVALTALGIDPEEDDRFIKNERTVVDGLIIFAVEGGGFKHIAGGKLNGMATEQGYYALAAYDRFVDGKTALYDMSDVELAKGESSGSGSDVTKPEASDKNQKPDNKETAKGTTKSISGKLKTEEVTDEQLAQGRENHYCEDTGVDARDNSNDILPWYIKLNVVKQEITDDQKAKVSEALGGEGEVFILKDIHFTNTKDGSEWQPTKPVKIKIPMVDIGDYENAVIVHITDDGKIELIKGTVKDGMIEFEADSFSLYGIAGTNTSINDLLGVEDDGAVVWPWIVIAIIALAAIAYIAYRRKREA